MEIWNWLGIHWFELLQTLGIVASLLFSAYAMQKDKQAQRIGNSIAMTAQYSDLWKEIFDHPRLLRVLANDVELKQAPITEEETIFVSMMIAHLSTVYRAMKSGEFIKLEALKVDVKDFYSLPIPRAVWEKTKLLQNDDFAGFMESVLK